MVNRNPLDELHSIWVVYGIYVMLKYELKIDLAWNNISTTREHDIFARIDL